MKIIKYILAITFIGGGLQTVFAQTPTQPSPTPKISETVAKNLEQATNKTPVPRERREQAYAKLLEGQRYIWNIYRSRSQTGLANTVRLAKQSLQKAVELDPTLAEGYTALAELTSPYDIDEAILLAGTAVKIDNNNYGGHFILAQLYTKKSEINRGVLDANFAQKAIAEWNEIARFDPRNAEAYAFLSEFYARTNKPEERVIALRNWVSAATPSGNGFYGRVFKGENLSPENASLKLAEALLKMKQTREAIEILSRLIAAEPENEEAIELLQQAVESADVESATIAVETLQQAINVNPENTSLVILLAQVYVGAGKIDQAAKVLLDTSAKVAAKDKNSAADLQVALGDLFFEKNQFENAAKTYQNAFTVRGIIQSEAVTDDARDFAIRVFDKMIETYKKANRPNDTKAVIERARLVLGKSDLFADKKLISFYLETGKKAEALQTVRALRTRNADDYALLRLEATILTDIGKIEEAVALIKPLIGKKPSVATDSAANGQNGDGIVTLASPMAADFSNYIFISSLYTQAKRNKEAIEAINQAYSSTQSSDRKEIAKLMLATAQQTAGDLQGAETTLREILKQSPQNPIALNNLGYFLAERGEKLEEALNLIEQAVQSNPTNPSYLDSLGWAYFKLGKLVEAEKYLKNALRFDNSSSTIHEHLGDIYQKQGKLDLAKSAWQKALEFASDTDEINRIKAKLTNNASK
ncbi:MAG: tetratricopeptide repeat protein [Acidobacteria bacterium]|jgi:tetratricopeptide (TPR) repeat protein|nr:tetratricopeptide repeat protein [Acidobacteriota bacterium]